MQVSNNFLFQHQLLLSIVWFKVHHCSEKQTDIIRTWYEFDLVKKAQKVKGYELVKPGQTIVSRWLKHRSQLGRWWLCLWPSCRHWTPRRQSGPTACRHWCWEPEYLSDWYRALNKDIQRFIEGSFKGVRDYFSALIALKKGTRGVEYQILQRCSFHCVGPACKTSRIGRGAGRWNGSRGRWGRIGSSSLECPSILCILWTHELNYKLKF